MITLLCWPWIVCVELTGSVPLYYVLFCSCCTELSRLLLLLWRPIMCVYNDEIVEPMDVIFAVLFIFVSGDVTPLGHMVRIAATVTLEVEVDPKKSMRDKGLQ